MSAEAHQLFFSTLLPVPSTHMASLRHRTQAALNKLLHRPHGGEGGMPGLSPAPHDSCSSASCESSAGGASEPAQATQQQPAAQLQQALRGKTVARELAALVTSIKVAARLKRSKKAPSPHAQAELPPGGINNAVKSLPAVDAAPLQVVVHCSHQDDAASAITSTVADSLVMVELTEDDKASTPASDASTIPLAPAQRASADDESELAPSDGGATVAAGEGPLTPDAGRSHKLLLHSASRSVKRVASKAADSAGAALDRAVSLLRDTGVRLQAYGDVATLPAGLKVPIRQAAKKAATAGKALRRVVSCGGAALECVG